MLGLLKKKVKLSLVGRDGVLKCGACGKFSNHYQWKWTTHKGINWALCSHCNTATQFRTVPYDIGD